MLLSALSENAAVAESRLLHPRQEGFVCIAHWREAGGSGARVWKEKLYPADRIDSICQALGSTPDHYMSQASFFSRRRLASGTHQLRCAFVDLDTYTCETPLDQHDALRGIEGVCRSSGFPMPSLIIDSGRGLYIKWIFDQPLSATYMQQWAALEAVLISLFRPLGADAKARDSSRVMRVLGSTNSKSSSAARVISDSGQLHNFRELCDLAQRIPLADTVHATLAQRRRLKAQQDTLAIVPDQAGDLALLGQYSAMREPVMLKHHSLQHLNWCRFLDLRDLVAGRGGVHRGSRDMTLFWMVSTLALSGVITPGNLWTEISALLESFPVSKDFQPETDGSLNTLIQRIQAHYRGEKIPFKGGQYSPIYTPSNDTLIDMLAIEPDEERSLRTIISSREKLRRADLKAPGRAERRELRQQDARAAVALRDQGHDVESIAQTLNRNRRTIYRWLRPDERAGTSFVETRGRKRIVRHPEADVQNPRAPRPCQQHQVPSHQRMPIWNAQEISRWVARRHELEAQLREQRERDAQWSAYLVQAERAQQELHREVLLSRLRDRVATPRRPTMSSQNPMASQAGTTGPPRAANDGAFAS